MHPGIYFRCLCERVREYQRRVPQEHAGATGNTKDLSRRQGRGKFRDRNDGKTHQN